jgi:hypothetical protein
MTLSGTPCEPTAVQGPTTHLYAVPKLKMRGAVAYLLCTHMFMT